MTSLENQMDAFITVPYDCIWNLSEKGKMAIVIHLHFVPAEILKSSRNANQAHFYTKEHNSGWKLLLWKCVWCQPVVALMAYSQVYTIIRSCHGCKGIHEIGDKNVSYAGFVVPVFTVLYWLGFLSRNTNQICPEEMQKKIRYRFEIKD